MSASASLTRVVLEAASEAGASARAIAAAAGVELRALAARDARVPHALHLAVWREANRQSGDDCFGLRVASRLGPGDHGAAGYAFVHSGSLGEALGRFARFSRLIYDEARIERRDRGTQSVLSYALAGREAVPALYEAALAIMLALARRVSGRNVRPRCVQFRHRAPPRRLPAWFGAEVRFGQPRDALIVDRAALAAPVRGADPTLAEILDRHAAELLLRLPAASDVVAQTRAAIMQALPDGVPRAEQIASALGLGTRSLQRRLARDGLTLRQLHDQVRHALALEHLRNCELSTAEIAFALGFSDPAAFHKAFRRWTGRSPAAMR